jgi:oligopeptide transport system substrate-binding protein
MEGDPDKRTAILLKAEEMFLADMPFIPIYFYTRQYLLHPSVKGWGNKVMDNHPYKFVDLVEAPLPDMN